MDCRQPGFFFHGSFRQGYWNGLTFPSPTCPLEWPMSKTLTTLNAREDVEISFIASRNAKWYSHFGGQWQIPTKVSLLYHTVQKLDWLVFTRRNWKLCPNKILAGIFYNHIIHTWQNLESTNIFFSRLMGEYSVVYPNNRILLRIAKNLSH